MRPFELSSFLPQLTAGLVLLAAGLAPPGEAQVFPHGDQLQVNTTARGRQSYPRVAVAGDGSFVVVWQSEASSGTDMSRESIQARRFAADGSPIGDDFQVNTFISGRQSRPAVAAGVNGNFVVAWDSDGSSGTDASSLSVQARRFAADGSPIGDDFQVNTATLFNQDFADIAMAPDGDFVVVWRSGANAGITDVAGQRFAADATPLGTEFQVNTIDLGYQGGPRVATDADGNFVVVWINDQGVSAFATNVQRFAADGTPLGNEFEINPRNDFKLIPDVDVADNGEFTVVWWGEGFPPDETNLSIRGQRFATDGTHRGREFQVNSATLLDEYQPEIGMEPTGDFVVVWETYANAVNDQRNIYGRHFLASGLASGPDFTVNTFTAGAQGQPTVAVGADGRFVVAWHSALSDGSDPGSSIQARRFDRLRGIEAIPTLGPASLVLLAAALAVAGGLFLRR